MEELNYNLLFTLVRRFEHVTSRSGIPRRLPRITDRLLAADVPATFFDAVQAHARLCRSAVGREDVTVHGTQLEAWANLPSSQCTGLAAPCGTRTTDRRHGNPTVDLFAALERRDRQRDTHQFQCQPIRRR